MCHRRWILSGMVVAAALMATPAIGQTNADETTADPPTEESLGFPIYPSAQFLTSYDAGRGQRYYLFGSNAPYTEMVTYYRLVLDEGGDKVFDVPPTHIFEMGRFREETMAFPPGVTIKDYTWDGSEGYLNPTTHAPGQRFPTIIQIVPAPPEAEDR